jgi:hypothetical protein
MKLTNLVTFNAVVCIAAGIAFSLYAPLMMAFFTVPDALDSPLSYWQVAAFARMYGVALLGLGLLLPGGARILDSVNPDSRRGSSADAGEPAGAIVASQQLAVWLAQWGGLLCNLHCLLHCICYLSGKNPEN